MAGFVILNLFFIGSVMADNTIHTGQIIKTVRFNGESKNLYLETSGNWDATECDPKYVWVRPTISGQSEIISIALAAKMAGRPVWFYGVCSTTNGPNYFEAHYIAVN